MLLFEARQRLAENLCLGTRHALCEPGECGTPIAGLRERGQHQFGHVRFAGRRGPVAPRPAVALPARESLLRQPV
jgi:hypothetical protein